MLIENMSNHDLRLAMLPYSSALKGVNMYVETIEEELFAMRQSNPIEHVKARLKRPSSIARKLEKKGYEPTVANAIKYIDDIAGVRIVCLFQDDIYRIGNVIENLPNIKVVRIKDYIKHPKESGNSSLHLNIEIPIFLQNEKRPMKVEVQLRTIAMDFWASVEHKLRYKKNIPDSEAETLAVELSSYADQLAELDYKMEQIKKRIVEAEKGAAASEERRRPLPTIGGMLVKNRINGLIK